MPERKLHNCLRAHRRRSGLSQREVAFLLGASRGGAQVSRHEKRRRLPPLRAALGYEVIYGVPANELFAGVSDAVAQKVKGRMMKLQRKLQVPQKRGIETRQATKKLSWFRERHQL